MNFILKKANFALLLVLCVTQFSCELEFWKEPPVVVAEIENSKLRLDELREVKAKGDSFSKEEWVSHIDAWINSEVMYREALKRGLHKDSAVQKLIKNAEKKILIDRLRLAISVSDVDIVSDKELQEFYEDNKELFRLDSVSYVPFLEVMPQIRGAVLSKRRTDKEKKWLTEAKNNYSIEVYPQYLDSL
ncbi:MAG: peptidylprolyl isomerase [Fibromonadales bacterium]|nr:peptidylprolyl isomerase [Fibromonadales bacterium]